MPSSEQIQAAIAVLGGVGSLLAAAIAFLWRLSSQVHTFRATQDATTAELVKLRAIIGQGARKSTEAIDALTRQSNATERNFALLAASLGEREKDILRIEGQIDQMGSIVTRQIAAVNGVISSLDALWRTLEKSVPGSTARFSGSAKG